MATVSLHWVPSRAGDPGNERADVLAVAAHFDNAATTFIDHFTKARRMLRQVTPCYHPYAGVSARISPPPVPEAKLHRSVRALLHHLRAYCVFAQDALYRLGDTEHVLRLRPNLELCCRRFM